MMKSKNKIAIAITIALGISALSACSKQSNNNDTATPDLSISDVTTKAQRAMSAATNLEAVINSRSDEEKARDMFRNPAQTLAFFELEPGMKVAEALPGGGWYSKIIANYLGADGELHGINYVDDMWARFGFFSPENIEQRIASTTKFPETVAQHTDNGIATSGFTFDTVPDDLVGTLDRVLFIRALHNLNRFEEEANTMTNALAAAHKLLSNDGMVGVVQHRAPESADDTWADGSRGYLKQSSLIAAFEAAGFELVSSSELNANAKDKPTESDIVWRLPPSYNGTRDDTEKKAVVDTIGESDRMTLLFKKVQG